MSDRRRRTLGAYWRGARNPRRRAGRRVSDSTYPIIDWHSPRVFALGFAILALCASDALLTIVLLSHGAAEINPVMALLVTHSPAWFVAIKLGLTGLGVCVLAAVSRMRVFRVLPGETLLYAVLFCYALLIAYQLQMLRLAHEFNA